MRIICVTHAYPRFDGDVAGAFIERLVLALRDRGHDVSVLAPSDRGTGGLERRHGVPVERLRYAPAALETLAYRGEMVGRALTPLGLAAVKGLVLAMARGVRRLCRERRADVIHAHWWVPAGLGAWLARAGAPYVVTLHGTDVRLLRWPGSAWVARRVLRRAGAVTAVSGFLAARAARVAAGRIEVQPMPAARAAEDELPQGGGEGGGIVTVGRLVAQKRIDVLVRAMAELPDAGATRRLVVVGDGPERTRLERVALETGTADRVEFRGQVGPAQVPDLIRRADVFAFPARAEGFGLAAAEALMLGIPVVVAADGGGVLDLAGHGPAVRVVDGVDPGAWAREVAATAADGQAKLDAREQGAQLRRRLAPERVAEWHEALYGRLGRGT